MVVSDKYKFILICTPKTASSAMRKCLKQIDIPIEIDKGGFSNHDKPVCAVKKRFPNEWEKYLTIGFCRNPFDRLVSLYSDFKNMRGMINTDFDKWVLALPSSKYMTTLEGPLSAFQPQTWYLCEDNKVAVKLLGKYERLEEDWKVVCNTVGIDCPSLPVAYRSSGHAPYQQFYTNDRVIEIVRNLYKEDFELLGYNLDCGR